MPASRQSMWGAASSSSWGGEGRRWGQLAARRAEVVRRPELSERETDWGGVEGGAVGAWLSGWSFVRERWAGMEVEDVAKMEVVHRGEVTWWEGVDVAMMQGREEEEEVDALPAA